MQIEEFKEDIIQKLEILSHETMCGSGDTYTHRRAVRIGLSLAISVLAGETVEDIKNNKKTLLYG